MLLRKHWEDVKFMSSKRKGRGIIQSLYVQELNLKIRLRISWTIEDRTLIAKFSNINLRVTELFFSYPLSL